MDEENDIESHVRFNPFKHHWNFISGILENASLDLIIRLSDQICNNYTDIYTGEMAPESIENTVVDILKSKKVFYSDDFTRWVASKKGYRKIQLEDRSLWVVRKSSEDERYIHIHPARSGPFSTRFKGSTLKTIYLLKYNFKGVQEIPSLEKVNRIRMQIGLSPVKKLDRNKGLLKCFEQFINGYRKQT
jgi:hypothetical protein